MTSSSVKFNINYGNYTPIGAGNYFFSLVDLNALRPTTAYNAIPATMAHTDDVIPKIENGVAATQNDTNAPDFMSLVTAFSIASSNAEKIARPAITTTYALGVDRLDSRGASQIDR